MRRRHETVLSDQTIKELRAAGLTAIMDEVLSERADGYDCCGLCDMTAPLGDPIPHEAGCGMEEMEAEAPRPTPLWDGERATTRYAEAAALVDGWYTERQAPTDRISGERAALILAVEHILADLDAARRERDALGLQRESFNARIDEYAADLTAAVQRAERAERERDEAKSERYRLRTLLTRTEAERSRVVERAEAAERRWADEQRIRCRCVFPAEGGDPIGTCAYHAAERARGDRLAGAVDALLGRCVGKMGETVWYECRVCDSAPALTADTIVHEDACAVVVARQALAAAGPCPQCGGSGSITASEHARDCRGDCGSCPVPVEAPCDHPSHRAAAGPAGVGAEDEDNETRCTHPACGSPEHPDHSGACEPRPATPEGR